LAEELVEFLHGLLRALDDKDRINSGWLASEVATSQAVSADAAAWKPLADAIGTTSKFASDHAWTAHEASTALLGWLPSLAEDYCRGPRSASIRAVCDVARCNRRNACLCLGRCGWDIELAIQTACEDSASEVCSESRVRSTVHSSTPFGGALAWLTQSRLDGVAGPAWSSRGAKLRKAEVECPICTSPYEGDANRVDTRCCFQVLCAACRAKLTDETGLFTCPFCRVSRSSEDALPSPCTWSAPRQLPVPFRSASVNLARSVSNGFEHIATVFLDVDRPRRSDIMSNVYRPDGSAAPRAPSSDPFMTQGV